MTLSKAFYLLTLLTFFVFLYAHEQVTKTILLYDIRDTQREKGALDETHQFLTVQVNALSSPPTLERLLAKEDLLLEFPESRRVIRLAAREEEETTPSRRKHLLDFLSATKVAEATSR